MYKLRNLFVGGQGIIRLEDNAFIPFDPANTDYQQFKKDLINGVELEDVNGNAMSVEAITTFIGTLL
jgi:hypothetical protein